MTLARTALLALLTNATPAQIPQLTPAPTPPPNLQPLPTTTPSRVLTTGTPNQSLAQWPGTYYNAAFRGTTVYLRLGPNHAIFHLLVDGNPTPLILKAPAPGTYRLAGLPNTSHTLKLQIATESQSAPNTFNGFSIPANETPLSPTAPLPRQIEFIGDSHTVGYGNTSPTQTCTQDDVWATTDDTQSFAALTAAANHADYQVNAISGRGIVRNYNNVPGDTLPVAYPYTLLNDKAHPYTNPAWHPQLLVIALGTNDFSTPLNPNEPWKTREQLHTAYEANYLLFLQTLHQRNPNAWIVLWATNMAHGEIESEVEKVVNAAKAEGLTHLDYIPFNNLTFTACHGHPSIADDHTIATQLTNWINNHPTLWQGK